MIDEVTATLVRWTYDDPALSNTAFGDSGGPGYLEVDGELFVAVITSGGSTFDAGLGDEAFSTRVDAYLDWIESVMDAEPDTDDGGADAEPDPPEPTPMIPSPTDDGSGSDDGEDDGEAEDADDRWESAICGWGTWTAHHMPWIIRWPGGAYRRPGREHSGGHHRQVGSRRVDGHAEGELWRRSPLRPLDPGPTGKHQRAESVNRGEYRSPGRQWDRRPARLADHGDVAGTSCSRTGAPPS